MTTKKKKSYKDGELISTHYCNIKSDKSSGDYITLETEYIANGDPGVYFTNQKIIMGSNFNMAEFCLFSLEITPEDLRRIANELESKRIQVKALMDVEKNK